MHRTAPSVVEERQNLFLDYLARDRRICILKKCAVITSSVEITLQARIVRPFTLPGWGLDLADGRAACSRPIISAIRRRGWRRFRGRVSLHSAEIPLLPRALAPVDVWPL